jgi:peptidoglycan L-alanyl-D-glutamate endopeptidase CwlK
MTFKLSGRSLNKLTGVHPDLCRVVKRAIQLTTVDFVVLEGARTLERQQELLASGASKTLDSRHIPGVDGLAKAIDLGAWAVNEVRWDWPLYSQLAVAVKQAAAELNVAITWGGDWKSFKDGPHFELSRKVYP